MGNVGFGWRTACGVIHNTTATDFAVLNPIGGRTMGIPAGGKLTFGRGCYELFWECRDVIDIRANALRFRWGSLVYDINNGLPAFLMFMQYETMNIMASPDPIRDDASNAFEVYPGSLRAGCLDVWIRRDPTREDGHIGPWYYPAMARQW
jgi:hypothetical protein